MKGVKIRLWSIWLSGFALIGLSFYSTQRLPPLGDQTVKLRKLVSNGVGSDLAPKIAIFSAPRPFAGSVAQRQSLAVRSWLGLSPLITVVLFSQHSSVFSFAEGFGLRVFVEPDIDFTFLGTPFLHSMMARSYSFESDITVFVDPEAVLFPDIISTLHYAFELDSDWFLYASPRNVSRFPFRLEKDGKHWRRENGRRVQTQKEIILYQSNKPNPCEVKKLMAWNSGDAPLHSAVLPPFLYSKGVHDDWIINEALISDFRFVFDASSTISSFYREDQSSMVSANKDRIWEYKGNSDLGMVYGSSFRDRTNHSGLVQLLKCNGKYTFSGQTENETSKRGTKKKTGACRHDLTPFREMLKCSLMNRTKRLESSDFPFSLESLLPLRVGENKTIVLAVAGESYKDMLMSWACRLRHLKIRNFIVSALDDETYRFSILQGLPVFRDVLAPSDISFNDCHFGTECFQRVTKVKSRTVLKILKLGYNVLLSDVDVYWFKNPLPFISSFGPAVLTAQSDEFNETGPINIPRRLNSGFYFARFDGPTITALEKVVKHAENSGMSEQPSFYDTLCGENGSNRVGSDACLEPETNLTVHFLDRNLFPNGAYRALWQRKNVRSACERQGCFVLHNNWINGRRKKLERQVSSGLWEFDISTRMCLQSWH